MIKLIAICALVLLVSLGCEATRSLGIGEPTSVEYAERGAMLRAKITEVEPTINEGLMWRSCVTLVEEGAKREEILDAALVTAALRSDGRLGEAYDIMGEKIELMEELERDVGACIQRLEEKTSWHSSDFPETFDFLFAQRNEARVERQVETIEEMANIQQDVVRNLSMEKGSGFDVPDACIKASDEWSVQLLELQQELGRSLRVGHLTVRLLRRYESTLAILSHLEKAERDLAECDRNQEESIPATQEAFLPTQTPTPTPTDGFIDSLPGLEALSTIDAQRALAKEEAYKKGDQALAYAIEHDKLPPDYGKDVCGLMRQADFSMAKMEEIWNAGWWDHSWDAPQRRRQDSVGR